ncbi:sigma factor-like helix-turn-helix DNA-binding protein [Paenibacillus sp. CCS19]|uniref:sigma factor-like helix-turn-helix DNA-binding protein n=1 Tax=Paenibacillus sp. CCS19 TaxID=3158387 RepID=UPI00295E98E9|nr:sigma factor-like helix-turn-helix DNA-binding protein [Paenibacillus cellulosilyticus]
MSAFEFLHAINEHLAQLAEQSEQEIWSNPRAALIEGRLFGEQLASLISHTEKVEPVYAIRQIDRIHLLARKDIISDVIRSSFEWLRMNGNTAAHDAKEVLPELALAAHRQIFMLAAWYAEAYGPLELTIPEYQLPMPVDSAKDQESLDHKQVSQEEISERLEKLLQAQLADKLLPTIDERFREMNELIAKFAGQMDTWAQKRPVSPVRNLQSDSKGNKPSKANPQVEGQGIEIAQYLAGKSLNIVDKRENGGALWVIGGWELNPILLGLKEQGVYFRFARNGSQSTKREPAWFLAGKNQSELRYVTEMLQADSVEQLESEVPQVEEVEVVEEAAQVEKRDLVESTVPAVQPLLTEVEDASDVDGTDGDTSVHVPSYLQWRKVASYPSRMSDIAESLGIVYFNDWSEDRLRELYRHQPKLLHEVLVQLWFFGFEFEDELSRFIKLDRPQDWIAVPSLKHGIHLENIFSVDILRQLERFGISTTDQLIGLPDASLMWLFRSKYDAIQTALQPYILVEDAGEAHRQAERVEPAGDSRIVRSADYVIEIPASLFGYPIQDLPIYGCSALITGIRRDCNLHLLGQLPEDLTSLLPHIKGAGPGALEKMAKQLQGFIVTLGSSKQEVAASASPVPSAYTAQTAAESLKLVWNEQVIELDQSDLAMPLISAEYAAVGRVARYLDEAKLTTVGSLPMLLEQLSKGESVGRASIDKFVSMLQIRLDEYRTDLLMQEQLQAMTITERIDYFLAKTEKKLGVSASEDELRVNRNLQMLHTRWHERVQGRKATLESLGQQFGLTRERVRQILSKLLRTFYPDVLELESVLRAACDTQQSFCHYPLKVNENFIHGLLEQIIEEHEGLVYLERYGWWTTLTQEEVDEKEAALRKHVNTKLRGRLWDHASIQACIEEALGLSPLPMELARQMTASEFAVTAEGEVYLANSKKFEIVEMVLRQFPEGVEIYKREEELMALANRIRPGEYVKERDFAAVFSRDEFMDTAYLWGRGTFIHRDHVRVDEGLVREVSDRTLEFLSKRSPISVNRLFPIYEQRLVTGGIPNEYALYTMLRKYGSSKLAPNKFPHIWHEEDSFQLTNAEQIKMYIREHSEPVTMEHLRDEFVDKRGWKKFTLEFSIQTDSDFVSAEFGVVGLREFYPFTRSDLAPIKTTLQTLLVETGVIHVKRLFELMTAVCTTLGIGSSYLLYDLLKGLATEKDGYRMVRYPLIISVDHPAEELTLQTLVEQYLEEQEAEVAREVVYHWVTEEVGARAVTLDHVLANSEDIFYYQEGQFGEYIHRTRLGWTAEKEKLLVKMVNWELEVQNVLGAPYVTIKRLMNWLSLPELENDVTWSEDLLKDCLRKSNRFQMLGSYDCIVVRRDEESITSETDWLKCLLVNEFNGRAPRVQWHRRLAELKYSMDGRFLTETLTKLENGSAPFVVRDDEVVLVGME